MDVFPVTHVFETRICSHLLVDIINVSHHIASHAIILPNKGCFSVTKNIHPLVTGKTSVCKRLAILAAGHFPKKSYRHKVENFF